MALKLYKPITQAYEVHQPLIGQSVGQYQTQRVDLYLKKSGRNASIVTVRHQGGRHKRFLRTIDWKRTK